MRKGTVTPAEILLALEETEHLLWQLSMLTERGHITWRCTDYAPLDLMPDKREGKPAFHAVRDCLFPPDTL